ncbi:MAG: hypothetical protein M3N07_05555 [Pseudomonadota bacterium]|nr:hypothetical protein [Pseudomonadota bacterium]
MNPVPLLAALVGLSGQLQPPLVPEGIYSEAEGPTEICGITALEATDFIRQVRASPHFVRAAVTDRFELYVSEQRMEQWAITREGEPAHPAVTCRHVWQDASGSWLLSRQMRCDASREACDRLFLEFRQLDEEMSRSLQE